MKKLISSIMLVLVLLAGLASPHNAMAQSLAEYAAIESFSFVQGTIVPSAVEYADTEWGPYHAEHGWCIAYKDYMNNQGQASVDQFVFYINYAPIFRQDLYYYISQDIEACWEGLAVSSYDHYTTELWSQ